MTNKYCVNKKSANINIYASVNDLLEGIKAPCEVRVLTINGWFVNPYISRRPDDSCNIRNWDGFSLEDENFNSNYQFIKLYDVPDCGSATYQISKDGNAPGGNIFFAIFPNGFSYEPWKQRVIVIDADNKEIFRKDYPLSDEIKFKVECIDGCPDGFLELKTDRYPGYCCVKCDDLKNQINRMIKKL